MPAASSTAIRIEARTTKGTHHHSIHVASGGMYPLADILAMIAQEDWAIDLFAETTPPVKMQSGFMLILDERMIQPWEIEDARVRDGQVVRFVQVVPGG